MEMGVVDVCFIAFCHHMPSHPDTAPICHQIAASKAIHWRVPQHLFQSENDVTCLAGPRASAPLPVHSSIWTCIEDNEGTAHCSCLACVDWSQKQMHHLLRGT